VNAIGATSTMGSLRAQIKARILLLGLFVGSMWLVFFLSAALPSLELNRHGVVPRTLGGLQGIVFAPWLHAGLWHIVANTGGLLILGCASRTSGRRPWAPCWAQDSARGCSALQTPCTSVPAAWSSAMPVI